MKKITITDKTNPHIIFIETALIHDGDDNLIITGHHTAKHATIQVCRLCGKISDDFCDNNCMDYQPSWAMQQTIEGNPPECENGIEIVVEDWARAKLIRHYGALFAERPNDDFFIERKPNAITIYNKHFHDGAISVGYIDQRQATINPMYVDYINTNWR